MRDISIRDMRHVDWGATLKLAGLRSVASALVLSLLGVIFGLFPSFGTVLGFFLFWVAGSTIGGLGNIYLIKGISALMAPVAGGIVTTVATLTSYLIALMLASGDPLIFALKHKVPDLVPVPDFGPMNLRAVIFVLDPEYLRIAADAEGDEPVAADSTAG